MYMYCWPQNPVCLAVTLPLYGTRTVHAYGVFRRMIVSREEMRSSSALFPAPESGRYA